MVVMNWSAGRKKHAVIAVVVAAALSFSGYTAGAVYSVHDSKVYAEIAEQISKVTEQISQIKTQIDLQRQNMQDLAWGQVDPILSEIESARKSYQDLMSGMSSILSGAEDAQTAFDKTFNSFDDLDVSNLSYSDLKHRLSQNRYQIERLDTEVVELINAKQKELDASTERIQEYTDMLKDAKGEKDTLQIQALIQNEQIHSNNIASEIASLQTKLSAVRAQKAKLEADASDKLNEKISDDFEKSSDDLKDFSMRHGDVESLSPTFIELAKSRGW